MSNATQDTPNPGRKRRRRNRGGQNRNEHNQQGRQGGRNEQGQSRRDGGRQGGRRDGGSNRGQRDRRAMPKPAPKLTLWQKIKKFFGLYKEPTRPTRGERQATDGRQKHEERQPVKSNIRIARPQERKEVDRGPVESPRLYLGNLSYDVTEADLTDLFKGVGGVRNVEIVYNRNTHRSKGYGFVEMLHVDDAKRAIEVLHDQPFMGRKMNVSSAKSKGQDEREDRDDDRPARKERPQKAVAPAQPSTESRVATPEAAITATGLVAADRADGSVAAEAHPETPATPTEAEQPQIEVTSGDESASVADAAPQPSETPIEEKDPAA